MGRKTLVVAGSLAVLAVVTAYAPETRAQRAIVSGTSGYEMVNRGVWDLGLENILLVGYTNDATGSALDAEYMGGIAVRYFLMNNFALGLSLNLLYKTTGVEAENADGTTTSTESEDLGFVGFITANYFVRMGNSIFFKPGIGVGGLYGRRDVPTPGMVDQVTRMTLYGGAGKIDLGFIFFPTQHFNLRAGVDIIFRFGAASPTDGDAESFFSIDAGFSVGLGYTF